MNARKVTHIVEGLKAARKLVEVCRIGMDAGFLLVTEDVRVVFADGTKREFTPPEYAEYAMHVLTRLIDGIEQHPKAEGWAQ